MPVLIRYINPLIYLALSLSLALFRGGIVPWVASSVVGIGTGVADGDRLNARHAVIRGGGGGYC